MSHDAHDEFRPTTSSTSLLGIGPIGAPCPTRLPRLAARGGINDAADDSVEVESR
jgi:hypothetical protein